MKFIKKSFSVILAILMVFSSFTLLANAAGEVYKWESDTKFYRMERNADGLIVDVNGKVIADENDEFYTIEGAEAGTYYEKDGTLAAEPSWVPANGVVAKGERVNARIFLTTKFALAVSDIVFFYSTPFLTHEMQYYSTSGSGYLLSMNTDPNSRVSQTGIGGKITAGTDNSGIFANQVAEGFLTAEDLVDTGWIYANLNRGKKAIELDGSEWFMEFHFTVNQDVSVDDEGLCYVAEKCISDPYERFMGATVIGVQTSGDGGSYGSDIRTSIDYIEDEANGYSFEYTAKDKDEDSKLTITTMSVSFDAGAGEFPTSKEKLISETHDIAPKTAITVPEDPEISGGTFLGWVPAGTENPTEADVVDVSAVKYGYADLAYEALYLIENAATVTIVKNYDDVTKDPAESTQDKEQKVNSKTGYTVKLVDEVPDPAEEKVTYLKYSDITAPEHYVLDTANVNNQNSAAVLADNSAEINLYYVPEKYTAKFVIDNGDGTTTPVAEFADKDYYTVITAPAKDAVTAAAGKEFTNWKLEGSEPAETIEGGATFNIDANVTYIAQFKDTDYTITYEYAGDVPENAPAKPENITTAHKGDTIDISAAPTAEGYTFLGWTVADADYDDTTKTYTVGTKNVTVTGTWAKNYKITYSFAKPAPADAVAPAEITNAINGTVVDISDVPTGTGYTFDKWTVEGADYDAETDTYTVNGSDVIVTGTWTANDYTYKYYLDDAKTILFAEQPYKYGETPELPEDPTDDDLIAKGINGKYFEMWAEDLPETVEGNMEFTAVLTAYEYYIEFLNKDGEALELENGDTAIVKYYDETVDSAIVTQSADVTGYTADGYWYIVTYDDDGNPVAGDPVLFPYTVTEDVSFISGYTVNKHLITYYKDEVGTENNASHAKWNVEYGKVLTDTYVPKTNPTKEGHIFLNWDTVIVGETMGDEPIDIYPVFEIQDYNVIWMNGTEQVDSKLSTYGTAITKTSVVPTREGFEFKGWAKEENGTVLTDFGTVPENGITFYAVFAADDHVEYKVNRYFMNTDGTYEGVAADALTFYGTTNTTVTYTPDEVTGFAVDNAQTNVLSGTVAADGSLELTVYYARDKHNVTYVANGENVDAKEVYYDAALAASDVYTAAPAGYTLLGWSKTNGATETDTDLGKMGTEDVTLYAVIKADENTEYTVETYIMGTDGEYGAPTTETKTGKTDTVASVTPDEKTGFSVDADKSVLSTTIKADKSDVIKVYYKRSQNTVTYIADGATVDTVTLYYDEAITASTVYTAAPAGFTLEGWSKTSGATAADADLGKMGTAPVTLYAVIKANTDTAYTIKTYTMGLDGQYGDPVTDTKYGTTGETINYTAPEITGFTADKASYSVVISADDTDVIEVRYERNKNDLAYTVNGTAISTVPTYYGAAIDGTVTPADDEIPAGYTFLGWSTSAAATAPDADLGTMGDEAKTLYAVLKADTDVTYTVNRYFMNTDGTYEGVEADAIEEKGTTNVEVTYVPGSVTGFTFDDTQANVLTGVVAGDGSLVLSVYYKRNTVKVTIGDNEPEDMYYGEEIAKPETPAVDDGYEFKGWVDEDNNPIVKFPVVVGTEDIVIKPNIVPVKYPVAFYVGDSEYAGTGEYDFGTEIAEPKDPEKTGYTFKGWALAEDGEPVAALGTVPVGGVTYYAIFEGNDNIVYTVKKFFMNETGTDWMAPVDDERAGKAGETVTIDFAAEASEGFTIDEANSTKTAIIAGDGSTIIPIYYNRNTTSVTINGVTTEKYYGTDITEPSEPKAEAGYEFGGWEDKDGKPVTFPITVGVDPIEIKPIWNKLSYNLTFKDDKGAVLSGPTSVEFGATITAPEIADKEGYTFLGWIAEGTGARFDGTMPATDVVYVATWNSGNTVQYKMETYIMNLNGDYELQTWAYGLAVTDTTQYLAAEALEGFTVDMDKSVLSAKIAGDGSTVLKAYYARNIYTLTFDGANEQQLYFGDAIPAFEAAAQTGKTFDKWVVKDTAAAAPATMPANNLDLVSTWTDTVYTITYVVNGAQTTAEYKYGETIVAPADPEVYGMRFVEWQPAIPATMPDNNLIIVANFTNAIYKVTFLDAEGNTFKEIQVRSGDAIILPDTTPTKEFHVFAGWDSVPATMPAEDIVIEPIFDPVPVKLIPMAGSTTIIDRDNMVIYGLDEYLDESRLLNEFLAVEGDGYITITPVSTGCYGTGTVVELYDRNNDAQPLETYYIVVFGDLNGDSVITTVDASIVNNENFGMTDWSLEKVYANGEFGENANYKHYMVMAANLVGDGEFIETSDVNAIDDYILGIATIDQTVGKVTVTR